MRRERGRIVPIFYVTQQSPAGAGVSPLLLGLQGFFGGGHWMRDRRDNCFTLRINSLQRLQQQVLPHFLDSPLHSEKRNDLRIFSEICARLQGGAHASEGGREEIWQLAGGMNKTGLRARSRGGNVPAGEAAVGDGERLPAEYVSGLCQGDGTFTMAFNPRGASPQFALGQHNLSLPLLYRLQRFFGCGRVYSVSPTYSRFVCSSLVECRERIIPHFRAHPLWDEKGRHFSLFSRGCDLLGDKSLDRRELMVQLVGLLYHSNCGGKRRRRDSQEYLKMVLS